MPHEHEMPAPVTTTIFLDLATAKEMSESALRVLGSPDTASSCSEIVMNGCGWSLRIRDAVIHTRSLRQNSTEI